MNKINNVQLKIKRIILKFIKLIKKENKKYTKLSNLIMNIKTQLCSFIILYAYKYSII